MKKIHLFFILGFCFIIYLLSLNPKVVGAGGDDGTYVRMAKSLAEEFRYMKTKFPPVFPTLLAIIWRIWDKFPQNIVILKFIPLIMGMIFIYFVYLFYIDKKEASLIALFTGISPPIVWFATNVWTEIPYSLFTILSFFNIMRYEQKKEKKFLILGLLFATISFFTRTIGFTLIIALCIYFLIKYKFRKKIIIGEIIWVVLTFGISRICTHSYIPEFWWKEREKPWLGTINVLDLISRIGENLWRSFTYGISDIVFPFSNSKLLLDLFTKIKLPFLWYFFQLIFSIPIILGFIISVRRKEYPFLHLYIIIYLVIIMCWNWFPDRFIVVLTPFLFYYLFLGTDFLIKNVDKYKKNIFYCVIIGALGISYIVRNTDMFYFLHKNKMNQRLAAFNWIIENTKEKDIIMTTHCCQIKLYTNRECIGFITPPYDNKELVADYIFISIDIDHEYFNLLVNEYKNKYNFILVWQQPGIFIYKIEKRVSQ